MLTTLLRDKGHEVISWIENCSVEGDPDFVFEKWVGTPDADHCFIFDTDGATKSDLVIYYGPAGKDACCEVGAAWASQVPVFGLYAKGEDLGLMRKMISTWCLSYQHLIIEVDALQVDVEASKKGPLKMLGPEHEALCHGRDVGNYEEKILLNQVVSEDFMIARDRKNVLWFVGGEKYNVTKHPEECFDYLFRVPIYDKDCSCDWCTYMRRYYES